MAFFRNNRLAQVCLAILIVLFVLGVWQTVVVWNAHRSLVNYAAFRGCRTMTGASDATATCTLANGQGITMVKAGDKWYLAGDLPVCYFGAFCW